MILYYILVPFAWLLWHIGFRIHVEGRENLKKVQTKGCTPYGINSHRLLVRGRRIETPDKLKHIRVTADAIKIEPIITAPIMALPLLLVLLLWLLFSNRKRKSTRGEKHETH